jgi:hypothetical protein
LPLLSGLPTRSSKALAQIFEHGNAFAVRNVAIENVQSERQKEMEMLLNRWNRNKQLASSKECNVNVDGASNTTAVLADQMKQVTVCILFILQILAFIKVFNFCHLLLISEYFTLFRL